MLSSHFIYNTHNHDIVNRGWVVGNSSDSRQLLVYYGWATSYIAQYPVLRTVQSALHFTSLTNLFTQTPSRLFWEASSHVLQLMREGCSYTYQPLSMAMYSFIQLTELEQCRVKKLAQGFNTAAQDSNPGSRSRESEAQPLSHCALLKRTRNKIKKYSIGEVFSYIKA